MASRVGIGIITYKRRAVLAETLTRVRAHTKVPCTLVVADDGSDDGTVDMLRSQNVTVVTGRNTGIAWNKNRALFLLAAIAQCDVVLLLEDDSYPTQDGWEEEWIDATQRWGHANLAAPWHSGTFVRGTGTVDDPIRGADVTAQCSGFSRAALLYGGYFDSRFRGYGFEHLEHSRRLVRLGYGGEFEEVGGEVVPLYRLLKGCIHVSHPDSFANPTDRERNRAVIKSVLFDESYRMPWRNDAEMAQFRSEMDRTLSSG